MELYIQKGNYVILFNIQTAVIITLNAKYSLHIQIISNIYIKMLVNLFSLILT